MTDASSNKIKMFEVSRWQINDTALRDSVDAHIEEVYVDRATEKSIWFGSNRYARFAKDKAFCASRAEALVALRRIKATSRDENSNSIRAYEKLIASCTKNVKRLNDFIALIEQELAASEGQ
jgi:hypothetical protein